MSEQKPEFDVVVVGLGPTGATLAGLLADFGLSVLILEREADIYDLPRAVHFDDEIMRVLQWIGVADEMSENVVINRGMRFIDSDGRLLVDWPRPQEVSSNGWHPSYRFHQPDLERILRAALSRRENVTIRLQQTVVSLEQDQNGVSVRFCGTTGGPQEQVRAQYVVGCDGARSTVRAGMGADMIKLGFEQRWLVVDLQLFRDMPELGDHTLQFCDKIRPATYCRNVGFRRRWEFALLDDEDDETARAPEFVWKLISRWITPKDAQLERSAIYTFKSEVAGTWVNGRLCLAGDAAHLTPPFLGQGLCAGIRDVANLAWKLADCCHRGHNESLLATYESERKPNVTAYIETAVRLGELINRVRSRGEAALGEQTDQGAIRMSSVQAGLGPGLGPDQDPFRGQLVQQIRFSDGRRLDDVAAGRSIFLVRKQEAELPGLPDVLMLCAQEETAVTELLNDLQADAVFVRPDMRILAARSGPDATIQALDDARKAIGH